MRPRRVTGEDYNGTIIKKTRPDDYRIAVRMLGSGIGKKQIAQTLGMAWWSVAAIERAEIVGVTQRRHHLAERAFSAASACLESAEARAEAGKGTAVDAKLMADAWLSLAGEPTQVVEHRFALPELDRLEQALAGKVVEAEAVTVPEV